MTDLLSIAIDFILLAAAYTLAVGFMILMLWVIAKNHANKQFQRFMKPGQACRYLNDPQGDLWIIEYIVGGRAVIYNPHSMELLENVNKEDLFV